MYGNGPRAAYQKNIMAAVEGLIHGSIEVGDGIVMRVLCKLSLVILNGGPVMVLHNKVFGLPERFPNMSS